MCLHFNFFQGFPFLWGPTHLPDLFSKVPPYLPSSIAFSSAMLTCPQDQHGHALSVYFVDPYSLCYESLYFSQRTCRCSHSWHLAWLRGSWIPKCVGTLALSLSTDHSTYSLSTTSSVTPSRHYSPDIPWDYCFLACCTQDKDIQWVFSFLHF